MRGRPWGARVLLLVLVMTGCSSPASVKAPSVTFGPAAPTPGMPGMSDMPAMPKKPTPPVAGDAVDIDNFAFTPVTLTVRAGRTVTWTNLDEEPHTVVADDGSFHSPGMGSQTTFSHTFTTAGNFGYVCSIHPFMHATVVVTA